MNILIVLGLGITGLAFLYFSKKVGISGAKAGTITQNEESPGSKLTKAKTSLDFLVFKNIKDKMIELDRSRFRAVIQVSPINWTLKTFDEQDILQTQFMDMLNGLRYPIDIYVARKRTDIKSNLELIGKSAKTYGIPEIEEFGEELTEWTKRWVAINAPLSHSFFIVVHYDAVPGRPDETVYQEALLELDTRSDTLIGALQRAGLTAKRLDDIGIAQLLLFAFNRDLDTVMSIKDAVKSGTFGMIVSSTMERKVPEDLANKIYGTSIAGR